MHKKIIIGADLVPTGSNYDLFQNGDINELLGSDLIALINQAEYRIFNLEVPLADEKSPIKKYGPNLIAPTSTICGIKKIGVDLFTLANNHIMDQGIQGLKSTLKVLEESGISHLGVGLTPILAAMPHIFECFGKRIGVYACAEHEFSIVTDKSPGANPYNPLESFDHISNLKENCDFVIVLYHGGKEHYRYPSPNLQRICHKFIEKGANLIVCQHSHCIGCEEKYQNGTIIYGQGNFIFDDDNSEYWHTSLLICIDEEMDISYIPLEKHDNVVRISHNNSNRILEEFHLRSEQIKKPGFVLENYSLFADEHIYNYLCSFRGRQSFLFRAVNKLTKNMFRKLVIKYRYGSLQSLALQNYIECEAHRELLLNGLKNK